MFFIVEDSLRQGLIVQLAELTQLTKCWKVPGQKLRPLQFVEGRMQSFFTLGIQEYPLAEDA